MRLGGSRCTLSKALGPSYFPSIRAGCIPRSPGIHPWLSNLSKLVDLGQLAIFKCFFQFVGPFDELKVVKGTDSSVLALTDETAKAKGLYAEAEKFANLWKSCNAEVLSLQFALIFASLRSPFVEEDAQPQDCVQRVAHILSSVSTKCWFWHFIVLWISVVLEYNVFVCRCKLYLQWRFIVVFCINLWLQAEILVAKLQHLLGNLLVGVNVLDFQDRWGVQHSSLKSNQK